MTRASLVKKLRIQPGQRVLIMNPPPGYMDELGDLPDAVDVVHAPEGTFDFVHLFVKNVAELDSLGPTAIEAVKNDGLLWVSYPKRSSKVETDITRDVGWDLMAQAGLRPVTQISIDDVWSALRFRPIDRVGRLAPERV
jgi:hypothetical protein